MRLAIITTHPIQYQIPWFRALTMHPEVDLQVFFCHRATQQEQAAAGFGVNFDWDIPLLEGYSYRFLRNVAEKPSIHTFAGLDTPEIAEIIEKERFDAVIVNGWNFKSAWQAFRACWRTGTPLMARGDSHLYTSRSSVKKISKWPFYRWFIPKLDACLAVGKWSREYYLHYGAREERVFFVPHVIDDNFFDRESGRLLPLRSELRREWKLEEGDTVFLFAGKFIQKKRPMDFVRAIQGARNSGAQAMGLMIGDGPLRAQCESYVQEHHLPVRFAGFLNQSQIARAYVAADALVLASDGGETWGLVVNEAMACGRPCFVSDQVGSGPDLIVKGETGAIFPMGNIEALAELLALSAADLSRLKEMGKRAKEMARKHSTQAAVEGVVQAISAVSE
jgi:glycosyltransferase involved in cell wall biosynthesis